MPRLARKNIKVFAGSATNNGVFGSLQANNPTITSDVEQLQSLNAWGEGWNAATETSEELPPLEEIQGVEYVTTYQQAYIMQEGIPEWAATVTYYKGCLAKEVTSTGFRIYNSLTDNNTGNLLSDTSNWKKVIDSDDLYAFDSAVVHDTGNETITGVKTFKGNNRIAALQNSTVTYNTAPASNTVTDLSIRDKDGVEMGVLEHVRFTNNNTVFRLSAKGADGKWGAELSVGKKADGTSFTSAPTPTAGDNSTNIATTAFVQTTASGLVHKTGNETIAGVKTFSSSPRVPTEKIEDNSTRAASTAFVHNLLSRVYPVGSIYIGTTDSCPLSYLISGSQWQLVAQNRALWGGNGSNANTTIAAGLPNITGNYLGGAPAWTTSDFSGALYLTNANVQNSSPQDKNGARVHFDASRSNAIYGNSSTVQPPAYVVNIWRRTA